MPKSNDDAALIQLNKLVLDIFKLNGRLLYVADRLTLNSSLTAARWLVLGAVLREPLPVASIARIFGLSRQSVQRLADILVDDGLCEYKLNPAHKRAQLLSPTETGFSAIKQIRPGVKAWADKIVSIIGNDALDAANAAIDSLLKVLGSPEGQVEVAATKSKPLNKKGSLKSQQRPQGRNQIRARKEQA